MITTKPVTLDESPGGVRATLIRSGKLKPGQTPAVYELTTRFHNRDGFTVLPIGPINERAARKIRVDR